MGGWAGVAGPWGRWRGEGSGARGAHGAVRSVGMWGVEVWAWVRGRASGVGWDGRLRRRDGAVRGWRGSAGTEAYGAWEALLHLGRGVRCGEGRTAS